MEFMIQREAFLKGLQLISGAIERKQSSSILSNVMFEAQAGGLLLITATDLEIELVGSLALRSEPKVSGEATASARKLIDICKNLPENAEIRVWSDDHHLFLSSQRSRFSLATLPTSGFPKLEERATSLIEFTLPQKELKRLMSRVYFSMGEGDVRYYLNGLTLEIGQGMLRLIAADGHRLSLATYLDDKFSMDRMPIIIPRKGVLELMRLLSDSEDEIKMAIGANHIRGYMPSVVFTSKLIDSRIPRYDGAIPRKGDKVVVIAREDFQKALARVAILSNEKHRGIRLFLSPELLRLAANNPEQEEAEEEISVQYPSPMELQIGFNVNYLLDVCNAISADNLTVTFAGSDSAILIEGVGEENQFTYVIMPMQL